MGSHIQERENKRRKLRRCMWLMYLLYKNEHKIFKSVEVTLRRGLRLKGEIRGDEPIHFYNTYTHGDVTRKFPVYLS
jgi:hypothetical protein